MKKVSCLLKLLLFISFELFLIAGIFIVAVKFPEKYPSVPPEIRFITRVRVFYESIIVFVSYKINLFFCVTDTKLMHYSYCVTDSSL